MSSLSKQGLRWIVAGVVAVGSVSAIGLTASAKSPAAGPQVATLAEPSAHAVPAKAKVKATKHKTVKHTAKPVSKKHAPRKAVRHTKHTAAKGKHKPAGKSHTAAPPSKAAHAG